MISIRTLLAGLAACMPHDEAEAVRTAAQVETPVRALAPAPRDPLLAEDQVLEIAP